MDHRRHRWSLLPGGSDYGPTVSVLVPAFNEERVIGKTLAHLLASDYPHLEVLVIDDGSKDDTAGAVAPFLTDPRVRYQRIRSSVKGAALNYGIRSSQGEILVMLDADTLFEPTTITRLVHPFEDSRVGVVAGNIKVGNRRGLLTQWQSLEYIIAINLEKRFFDLLHCITVVPGSVGAWRREALNRVGGFSPDTLAEDTDLTFAVRRAGYRICFEPAAVAWTEAPATVWSLAKQRLRWVFGTFQCLWKHRGAFLRPEAGTLGLVAMPYVLLFHVLQTLLGPVMDLSVAGMCLMGQGRQVIVLACSFLVMEWLQAGMAFTFDREPKWPLLLLPLQRLIYRYIIYWVAFRSALCVLRGTHPGWQKLARTGTATVATTGLVAALLLLPAEARAQHWASLVEAVFATVRKRVPLPADRCSEVRMPARPAGGAAPSSAGSTAPPPAGRAPIHNAEAQASSSSDAAILDSAAAQDDGPAAGHLPAALFDFEEFWDLTDGHTALLGIQGGAYLQPVGDGRGAAIRSGISQVVATKLDRATTLAMERFQGRTYRPEIPGRDSLASTCTSLKLTRRLSPSTTLSVQQLAGDGQTTLLEARCWRQVGRRWQFGGLASSQATLSLFLKHRM